MLFRMISKERHMLIIYGLIRNKTIGIRKNCLETLIHSDDMNRLFYNNHLFFYFNKNMSKKLLIKVLRKYKIFKYFKNKKR